MDEKKLEQYIEVYNQVSQSIMHSMSVIQKKTLRNSGITPDQFNLMNVIKDKPMSTSTNLADEFGVKKSSITSIVRRLVDKNLVTRVYNKSDRRIIHIELTEKGIEVLEKYKKKLIKQLMPLGSNLTEQDINQLITSLMLIATQLNMTENGGFNIEEQQENI